MTRARGPVALAVIAFAVLLASCSLVLDLDGLAGHGTRDAGGGDGALPADGGGDLPEGAAPGSPVEAGSPDGAGSPDEAGSPDGGCRGSAGPAQIRVGAYCIDTTEVTAAQYAAFVVAMGTNTGGQPPECAFNTSFAPASLVPTDARPARHVDWCDAFAYCKWAGKHLCGAFGGGKGDFSQHALVTHEWFSACSAGGARVLPYGNTYAPDACNVLDSSVDGEPIVVATNPSCAGWDGRLFDMSGNVREWEQLCEPGTGTGSESCITAGGAANDPMTEVRCADSHSDARNYTSTRVGFRCCSE